MNNIIKERLKTLLQNGKIKDLKNFILLGVITQQEAEEIKNELQIKE